MSIRLKAVGRSEYLATELYDSNASPSSIHNPLTIENDAAHHHRKGPTDRQYKAITYEELFINYFPSLASLAPDLARVAENVFHRFRIKSYMRSIHSTNC